MASMPKPRLPHLRREKSRHGKIKWFYRKGNGPRIRLPDDYGSDEFKAAYYAADKAAPCTSTQRTRHSQNTLGWLFDMYEQSAVLRFPPPPALGIGFASNASWRTCQDAHTVSVKLARY
jgi:hypothetical protein